MLVGIWLGLYWVLFSFFDYYTHSSVGGAIGYNNDLIRIYNYCQGKYINYQPNYSPVLEVPLDIATIVIIYNYLPVFEVPLALFIRHAATSTAKNSAG